MPRLLFRWIFTSLAIFMVPHLVSGVHVEGLATAVAAAAILGILNLCVKPILILLTLPLTVFSLGFFLLIINALIFQLAGKIVSGFVVDSFGSAFLAALVVSVVSWVTSFSTEKRNGVRVFVMRDASRPEPPRNVKIIDVTPRKPEDH